jgi:prevent-host-death family protein
MRLSEDIKPVEDLATSGPQMVRRVAKQRRTILLTDKGAAKAVLMDVASYDRWRDTVALIKLIAQSEADAAEGRTVPQDEAFVRAEKAITETEQANRSLS